MRAPSLLDLETEQHAVVDLPFRGSHVVTGSPGSGKSVLAVYRAWALATIGHEVVLLTRSNVLHQYLAQLAPDLTEAVRVTTSFRWIRDFWNERFGSDPPTTDEEGWRHSWVEMQQTCIVRGVTSTAHLVVDEGQGLPVDFYRWCRVLGVGITVFADENQEIGDDQSTVSEIHREVVAQTPPLVLRGNRRNSREIAMLASEFQEGRGERIPLPSTSAGRTPTVLKVPSLDHLVTGISRYFSAHPERSIGIICRSNRLQRDIQSRLTNLGLAAHTQAYVHNDRYRNAVDFSTRPIRILNTNSMKGLEFDSVFVPDLDAYTEDPTGVAARLRFFVLCTRAREDLHLAHRGSREPAILSDIPESLLARHAV